ncbi:DHH family phosphoesterase [Desulfovulcanus sp.]
MTKNLEQILTAIKENDHFLVTAHINPDGDAIGAMAAMGYILQSLRKNFVLFNESGLPQRLAWLKLPGPIIQELPETDPEWLIVLDSGDSSRPGEKIKDLITKVKTINIDHHLGNPNFGLINWVEPRSSSVGEMVAQIARELGVSLQGPLAEAIYLAIASDTGGFSFGNTTPEVLELTAHLIRQGLDYGLVNAQMQKQWSINRIKLQGKVLLGTELHLHDQIGLITITEEMFKQTGAGVEDCEGLVNYIRNIKSVKVAISLREDGPKKTKFSLRSYGKIDVQQMARDLGGGGHRNASGGSLEMSLTQAKEKILSTVRRYLTS